VSAGGLVHHCPTQKADHNRAARGGRPPGEIESTARRDEIGQLQQSIQRMAHHLKSQLADMRTERGKLEAVLENMTDGVIIVDPEGLVQRINPAALRLFRGR
jgi:signal transduction histidine kinase